MKQLPTEYLGEVDTTLAKPTRIHQLRNSGTTNLWIKREDELSSGISGSKLRKYSSLIPFLKKSEIELVAMVGGPNSNNLVGLAQLLKENSIPQVAFIREPGDKQLRGNALLLDMLLNKEEIRFVPRNQWKDADKQARSFLDQSNVQRTYILSEGCFGIESLAGAMTLSEDILRNEKEENLIFERIYIDCGTGLSAMGLILGLDWLSTAASPKREVVVTLIAETESGFLKKLNLLRSSLEQKSESEIVERTNIRLLKPKLSPKFGSVNKSLFQECRDIARSTGIVMDPTYSVKHYHIAKQDLSSNPSKAPSLFIFNGSSLGILGFQDKLAP